MQLAPDHTVSTITGQHTQACRLLTSMPQAKFQPHDNSLTTCRGASRLVVLRLIYFHKVRIQATR